MSEREGFAGLTRAELAIIAGLVFLGIFAGSIIYMLAGAALAVKIEGTIDANYVFGIFTGIIMSVMAWLGISRMAAGGKT